MIHSVSPDGFEMKYIQFGEGTKTMVILPGLSVQSVLPAAPAIEKQYECFKKEFTVYLFDRRESLPPVYSVFDMAEDTAKAMQTLGLSDVCLFGASQGGMMAMTIAARYPTLVKKLALGSAACRIARERGAVINDWVALAERGDAEALCLAFGEKVYPPQVFLQYREAFVQMAATVTPQDLKRFCILASGISGFDATPYLADIVCPVLVLGDTQDSVLGADAAADIVQYLKGKAQLYLYEGYGHAAYDTAPDYQERMLRFFSA